MSDNSKSQLRSVYIPPDLWEAIQNRGFLGKPKKSASSIVLAAVEADMRAFVKKQADFASVVEPMARHEAMRRTSSEKKKREAA